MSVAITLHVSVGFVAKQSVCTLVGGTLGGDCYDEGADNDLLIPIKKMVEIEIPSTTSLETMSESIVCCLLLLPPSGNVCPHIHMHIFNEINWYQCNLSGIPHELVAKFVQLDADNETLRFIELSEDKSDWIFTQIWHSLAKAVLCWFMTQTSINGWLQRGSMFVVSQEQFQKLMCGDCDGWRGETLLDLGAGDGEVTAQMAPAFRQVYVTEVSKTMQNLLRRRGYQLLDIDKWNLDLKYDVISCLNLLDRCDKPIELLEQMRAALNPGGFVLVALVLPFSPYVESGSADHKPAQWMPIVGLSFEEQVVSFVQNVVVPAGFEVLRWSRVPYLCEGDLRQSYYWLDDSIFVLTPRPTL